MKTRGPVLCVEDLRLAARASTAAAPSQCKQEKKARMAEKAEALMEGKRSERVGEGTGGRGRGVRGGGAGGVSNSHLMS